MEALGLPGHPPLCQSECGQERPEPLGRSTQEGQTCTLVLPPQMENGSSLSYENLWKFQLPWTDENDSCCQAGYFKAIYITLLNKTPQG